MNEDGKDKKDKQVKWDCAYPLSGRQLIKELPVSVFPGVHASITPAFCGPIYLREFCVPVLSLIIAGFQLF